ncbi:MAG: hypothetical protein ABIA47_01710 [bacterium]
MLFSQGNPNGLLAAGAAWPTDNEWYVITSGGEAAVDESAIAGCVDPTIGANPAGANDIASQAVCKSTPSYNPGNDGQPGSTIRNTFSNGFYYTDPNDDSVGCANISDDYVQYRTRIAGNPVGLVKKGFTNDIWFVRLDGNGDGIEDFYIRLNGNGDLAAETLDVIYETSGDGDPTGEPIVASHADPITQLLARSGVTPDNGVVGDATEYFIDFQIPMTDFKDTLGNQILCQGDAMITANYSTSATASDPDQKDYILGAGVFSDPITFSEPEYTMGKTVNDLDGGSISPGEVIEYVVKVNSLAGNVTSLVVADDLPVGATFQTDSYGAGTGIQVTYTSTDTGDIATYALTNAQDAETAGCTSCAADYGITATGTITFSNDWLFSLSSPSPLYDEITIRYRVSFASPGTYSNQAVSSVAEITGDLYSDDTTVDDGSDCTTAGITNCNDGDTGNDDETDVVIINAPNLSTSTLTEDDADNLVTPGQTVTYTASIINSGTINATEVTLDITPNSNLENIANVTFSGCGTYTNNSTSSVINVDGLDINAANTCTITYEVDVVTPNTEGETIPQSATIGVPAEGGSGATPSATTLTVDITPVLAATLAENDTDNTVGLSQVVTYTLTVSNSGDGPATGVTLSETLDTDVENLAIVSNTNCGTITNNSTGTALNISNVDVALGADCVVVYTVQVKPGASNGATIPATTTVGAATEGGVGTAATADTLTVSFAVSPSISATQVDDDLDNVVARNQTVTYTLTISNSGTASGSGITAYEAMDPQLDTLIVVSNTNCGAITNNSTGTVLDISDITVAVGIACVIEYTGDVASSAVNGDTIPNTVTIGAPIEGGGGDTATADTLTVSVASTDVALGKSVDDNTPDEGATVTYTITATNLDITATTILQISDRLPTGVTYVSNSTTAGTYNSGTAVWDIGALNAGASATLTLIGTVNAGTAGTTITNTASITSVSPPDSNTGNDDASVNITVNTGGDDPNPPNPIIIPTNPTVIVPECTATPDITMTLSAGNSVSVLVSEGDSLFTTNNWEAFSGTAQKGWTLASGDGWKTIFAKFRSSTGNMSSTVFDQVYLDEANQCEDPEDIEDPEEPEIIEEPPECRVQCGNIDFDLYIINPDGTERHMNSIWTKSNAIGYQKTRVGFEDKGLDFDYNDVIIDINQYDCKSVVFEIVGGDASWHHQIRVKSFYEGVEVSDVEIWHDSQIGFGRSITLDSVAASNFCPADTTPVSEPLAKTGTCKVACSLMLYDIFIVNPDGNERHTNTNFTTTEQLSSTKTRINFEDKGDDFDYNDVVLDVTQLDCENFIISYVGGDALWSHEVWARFYYLDQSRDALLWADSQTARGDLKYSIVDALDHLCVDSEARVVANTLEELEDGEKLISEVEDVESATEEEIGPFLTVEGMVDEYFGSATSFTTNLSSPVSDAYVGGEITFISGPLAGQARIIITYDGNTHRITVGDAFTAAPRFGDKFTIVLQDLIVVVPTLAEEDVVPQIGEELAAELYLELLDSGHSLDAAAALVANLNNATEEDRAELKAIFEAESVRLKGLLAQLGVSELNIFTFEDLFNIDAVDFTSQFSVRRKLADFRALASLIRRLIENKASRPVVESYMKFGSVSLDFLVANPLDSEHTVRFQAFLPDEVTPESVLMNDGLQLAYSSSAGRYYAFGDIQIGAGELFVRNLEVEDIWRFSLEDLNDLKLRAAQMVALLKNTDFESQGVLLAGDVSLTVDLVLAEQEKGYTTPQHHILSYRRNLERLDSARQKFVSLESLILTSATQLIQDNAIRILRLLAGVVGIALLLGLVLSFLWFRQGALEKKMKKAAGKKGAFQMAETEFQVWLKNQIRTRKISIIIIGTAVLVVVVVLVVMVRLSYKQLDVILEEFSAERILEESVLETSVQVAPEAEGTAGVVDEAVGETADETVVEAPVEPAEPSVTRIDSGVSIAEGILQIRDLPAGYAYAFSEPSEDAEIVASLNVGEAFGYYEVSDGWHKIKISADEFGWLREADVEILGG